MGWGAVNTCTKRRVIETLLRYALLTLIFLYVTTRHARIETPLPFRTCSPSFFVVIVAATPSYIQTSCVQLGEFLALTIEFLLLMFAFIVAVFVFVRPFCCFCNRRSCQFFTIVTARRVLPLSLSQAICASRFRGLCANRR